MPENVESTGWEVIKIVGTEEEANLLIGFLNNSGIRAEINSLLPTEFPVDFGHLGEVRVCVPSDQAQEAQALLNEREDVATGEEGEKAGAPLDPPSGGEGLIEP